MLSLPSKFINGFGSNSAFVYPIVVINPNEEDHIIRLSRKKGMFDNNYYEDRFLEVGDVSEKIDISGRKFQINQVSITVSNYIIEQIRFTEKFKNKRFINNEVHIYYANDACLTLEDCALIYKGFVKDYKADDKTAEFKIEDHSQYVLDIKTLPRGRTIDPQTETIVMSQDAVIPMTYGKVDKAPMIYSRALAESTISKIIPDDVMGTDSVRLYGFTGTEPLLMLRGGDYIRVPQIFQDLPIIESDEDDVPDNGFYINGYDYRVFNGTTQYEVDEEASEIIIEKKVSDATYTFGLPQNIQARDQFQIRADREATGIDIPEVAEPLDYGANGSVKYQKFDVDKSADTAEFYFPVPTEPLLAGWYKNMQITGIYARGQEVGSNDEYYNVQGDNSTHLNDYCTGLSQVTNVGNKGYDGLWLPPASDLAQYIQQGSYDTQLLEAQSIGSHRVRGWVWGIGGREVHSNYNNDHRVNECEMTGINGDGVADGALDNLSGQPFIPFANAPWYGYTDDYQNAENYNYSVYNLDRPSDNLPLAHFWGDETSGAFGSVFDSDGKWRIYGSNKSNLHYNVRAVGSELLGLWVWNTDDEQYWDYEDPNTYTIIPLDVDLKGVFQEMDTWYEAGETEPWGERIFYRIDESQANWVGDGRKSLRKFMWGRKITAEESQGYFDDTGLYVPMGSTLFNKFPVLSNVVKRSSEVVDVLEWWPPNADIGAGHYLYEYTYYVDCKYSWRTLDGTGNLNYGSESNLQRVQGLTQYPSENSGYQFVPYRENYDGENFFPVIFKHMSEHKSPVSYEAWNTEVRVSSTGIDAYYGGDWANIQNINNVKEEVKIDLTYNSIDGADIAPGGVHQYVEGELALDFYHQGIGNLSSTRDQFVVECNAFEPGAENWGDNILQFEAGADVDVSTLDEFTGEPSAVQVIKTGHQAFFDNAAADQNSDFHEEAVLAQSLGVKFRTPDPIICDEPGASDLAGNAPNPSHILMSANNKDLVADWKDNANAINNLTLHFRFPHNDANASMWVRGWIRNFSIRQLLILTNASKQKYFADVWGRLDIDDGDGIGRYTGASMLIENDNTGELEPYKSESQIIEKPSDIMMHIFERELGYFNGDLASAFDLTSVELARTNHNDWYYAFSLDKETKAKDFIASLSRETKFIPRFRYDGTFSFMNMRETYAEEDLIINSKDVISFNYSKTPINDIKLKVRVKYQYDVGNSQYNAVTNIDEDGAVPVNLAYLMDHYGIKNTNDAYLEIESKYIRDEGTALKLRDFLLEWNKNQHNIIECELFPKYMELECGDVVRFDSLIQGMTIFGDDYTSGYRLNGNYDDGGQWVYPYFLVTQVKKSMTKISVTLFQLHKHEIFNVRASELADAGDYSGDIVPAPEFGEEVEEELGICTIDGEEYEEQISQDACQLMGGEWSEAPEEIWLLLGDWNQDNVTNILDVVGIVGYVVGEVYSPPFGDYSMQAVDTDGDNDLTVLDIVAIIQIILNVTEEEVLYEP